MTIIRLSSTIPLFLLLLTACSSNVENPNDETVLEEAVVEDHSISTGNPCLAQWAIQSMKDKIIEGAIENIEINYRSDTIDTSSLYSTDIGFSYITQPIELENGDWGCSAEVDITYIGNDKSDSNLSFGIAKTMNANPLFFSSMGISPYNTGQFRNMKGNSFSVPIEYEIKTTYSETGEGQKSWNASLDSASAMLAVIAVTDDKSQRRQAIIDKYEEGERARKAAAEATGDYEEHTSSEPPRVDSADEVVVEREYISSEPPHVDSADEVVVEDEDYSEY